MTFSWRWEGRLAPNWGFEVRLWHEGDPSHFGAFDAREMAKLVQHLPDGRYTAVLRLDAAYSILLHGSGDYLWSIAVVQLEPYERIGPESAARALRYVRATAG